MLPLIALHKLVSMLLDETDRCDDLEPALDAVVEDGSSYNALERLAVQYEAFRTAILIVKERDVVHDRIS